jgi:site-specific recombinase XerD
MDTHSNNLRLVTEWLTYLRNRRGRQPSTIQVYSSVIHEYVKHLGAIPLADADVRDMDEFVARPRTKKGAAEGGANATRRKEASVLRSFYRWMFEQHMTEVNLALGLHTPTVHNVQPKSLSDEHWLAMWDSLAVQTNMRAVTVLGLGFYCGLRRDEMMQLRGSHIRGGQIVGFPRKGGGEDTIHWSSMYEVYRTRLPHLVGEHPHQFPQVLEWSARKAGDGSLIGWSAAGTMNKALARWAARCQVPTITPHQLRHSCATNLLRAGVPLHIVSSLLNHRSINTTMRYVRAGHDALAEWMHLQDSSPPTAVDVDKIFAWREDPNISTHGDTRAGGSVDAESPDRGRDR